MFFRGTAYTYGDFFNMVERYAKALKTHGVNKGDEFVVCLLQTPDYPVAVAAASLIVQRLTLLMLHLI
ncbi:MAG: AMP-binding protein [Pseudobutyrivibrio sp.]|nr:AMP-binding protein [Pseudobutyrivibrio sp.]